MDDTQPVLEVVLFRLREGVSDAEFLRAADAVALDLRQLSGYISRELLRAADGQWIDTVRWRSLREALDAAAHFGELPSASPFNAMIDRPSTMLHVETLRRWE